MPFTENLDAFLDVDDFATAMTYKVGGVGAGSTVNVIFDEPEQEHLGISGTRPTATGKASDFASAGNTDTLTSGATVYRIVDVAPVADGAMVELQLEKQ